MGKDVEQVAASLVREYLSRKGLKKTIACLDEELPRTNLSINNRSELRRILHLESLYIRNKSEEQPLKSMLEIIVKERMKKSGDAKRCQSEDSQTFLAQQESPTPNSPPYSKDSSCVRGDKDLPDLHRGNLSESESSTVAQLKAPSSKDLRSPKSSTPPFHSSLLSESERNALPSTSTQDEVFPSTRVAPDADGRLFNQDGPFPSARAGPGQTAGSEGKLFSQDSQGSRGSRPRRALMTGPIAASQETNRRRPARKCPGSYTLFTKSEEDSDRMSYASQSASVDAKHSDSDGTVPSEREDGTSAGSRRQKTNSDGLDSVHRSPRNASACSPRAGALHAAGMVLDDVNDEDLCGLSTVPISNTLPQLSLSKRPMDLQTAIALKELLFGSAMACFNAEWKHQSFTFSVTPALRYGIVQKKGGPCGVLAAVQATVLQKLLFEGSRHGSEAERLQVSDAARTACLTEAVAEILWRAGSRRRATVAINSGRRLFTPVGHYRSDGILDMITCMEVESLDDLKQLLEEHIRQFESGPFGCAFLVLSAVLSRTIQGTRDDMDTPASSLIAAHGYCTQELVNLLLCGRAVSNVFDDEVKLDSGNGNFTLLKGITERCNIGLLSLFEHYNICKVGSCLKTPRFPIWVVCSESHFTVLFSLCEDLTSSYWRPREFDLFYYDGLANQIEPIRLTVYPDSALVAPDTKDLDSDLIPPLELCIRTRWPDAVVSWNETEPIL